MVREWDSMRGVRGKEEITRENWIDNRVKWYVFLRKDKAQTTIFVVAFILKSNHPAVGWVWCLWTGETAIWRMEWSKGTFKRKRAQKAEEISTKVKDKRQNGKKEDVSSCVIPCTLLLYLALVLYPSPSSICLLNILLGALVGQVGLLATNNYKTSHIEWNSEGKNQPYSTAENVKKKYIYYQFQSNKQMDCIHSTWM